MNQKCHPKKLKLKDEPTIPVEIFIPKIEFAKEQRPRDELVTYSSKSRLKLARKARVKPSQRALYGLSPPSYDTSSTSSSTNGHDDSVRSNFSDIRQDLWRSASDCNEQIKRVDCLCSEMVVQFMSRNETVRMKMLEVVLNRGEF